MLALACRRSVVLGEMSGDVEDVGEDAWFSLLQSLLLAYTCNTDGHKRRRETERDREREREREGERRIKIKEKKKTMSFNGTHKFGW